MGKRDASLDWQVNGQHFMNISDLVYYCHYRIIDLAFQNMRVTSILFLLPSCLLVNKIRDGKQGKEYALLSPGWWTCTLSLLVGIFFTPQWLFHYFLLLLLNREQCLKPFCMVVIVQLCPTLCDPMDLSTQAFLSFTISWSLLKLLSIESVTPSNHLILFLHGPCPNSSPQATSRHTFWKGFFLLS